jgi:hypothetical protein
MTLWAAQPLPGDPCHNSRGFRPRRSSRAMTRCLAAVVFGLVLAWTLLARPVYSHNPTTTTVLFNREIATLLQRKCLQCHADGKMAMPLATYAQARPWAEAIKEEALTRRMPPWPAERGFGAFSNDIGLTPREFEFLISWIDGGVPEGTDPAPAFVDHSAHWMLGMPDVVLAPTDATTIEPRTPASFTRITVDTGLTRDAWLRGFDFKPDARVTRAAFLSVAGTDQYLGGWTPWQSSTELPADVAVRIPAHARIAIDVLYAGSAQRVMDAPKLGLYYAQASPRGSVTTTILKPAASTIPGAGRTSAELKMANALSLVSLRPMMQPGARSLEIKLLRPDGSRDVLLWVKQFRQEWPTPYVFKQPVAIPAGSTLRAVAYFESPPPAGDAPFSIAINSYRVGVR